MGIQFPALDGAARSSQGRSVQRVKVKHVLFLAAAVIGVLYVAHMLSAHQGQSILPGVGLNIG